MRGIVTLVSSAAGEGIAEGESEIPSVAIAASQLKSGVQTTDPPVQETRMLRFLVG